jgi:hypothetical protein
MRDAMDRSRRLTDGTRWRTFMRLLLFDDLMTSYTNARPELASSWWISTSARGIATVDGPTAVRRS